MKKFFAFLLVAVLTISLCACGAPDITGAYSNIFLDPVAGAVKLENSSDAALTISEADDGFSYVGEEYKGIGKLEENILILTPQEGVSERNDALLELEIKKGEDIDEEYIVYNDYLIKNIPLDYDEQDGEIPTKNKKTDCSFDIPVSMGSYFIELYEDGTCEIEYEYEYESLGETFSSEFYYEGTYSVDGQVILMTLTYCEWNFSGNEATSSGQYTCALYVDEDGEIYDKVYKKQ